MLFAPAAQHVTSTLGVKQQKQQKKQQLTPIALTARCSSKDKFKAKNNNKNNNKIIKTNIDTNNNEKEHKKNNNIIINNKCHKTEDKSQATVSQLANKVVTPITLNRADKIKSKVERLPEINDEVMEAMRKLDSELVAYLECTDKKAKLEHHMMPDRLVHKIQINNNNNDDDNVYDVVDEEDDEHEHQDPRELFKRMSIIKLHMEALTLQVCGIKSMALAQSDIRPIFTVECRLSPELIKHVPPYKMFHIMQFESEKFNSLTQCTRFDQDNRRQVRLLFNNADDENNLNFGRIHITVWWREPGTCINEMLGMGILELSDLYNAGTLEQCKCIAITRRNVHLVNLYMKISIFTDGQQQQTKLERRLEQEVTPFDNVRSSLTSWKMHTINQQQHQMDTTTTTTTTVTANNDLNGDNNNSSACAINNNNNNNNLCSTEAGAIVAVTESGNKYVVGVS